MLHDITDLRFFVTITESGSLAEAARRLEVTASAVSQRLRHLEARLGVPLAHRSTRRFVLTEEGELFRDGVSAVLAKLDRVLDSVHERSGDVTGTLNVGAPVGFGRRYLAAVVADFQKLHPQLKVCLMLSDVVGPTDCTRFDLIVHIGRVADSTVMAYPIAPNQRVVCAAPSYLAQRLTPREPKELAGHDCIVLREYNEDVTFWRFQKRRAEATIRVRPVLSTNDGDVAKEWAIAGRGLVVRSEWDVAQHLAAGELVRVLGDWTLPDADIMALAAARIGMPARAKLFLEFLQERFAPEPPWRLEAPARARPAPIELRPFHA